VRLDQLRLGQEIATHGLVEFSLMHTLRGVRGQMERLFFQSRKLPMRAILGPGSQAASPGSARHDDREEASTSPLVLGYRARFPDPPPSAHGTMIPWRQDVS
jgi:hypothetical protein